LAPIEAGGVAPEVVQVVELAGIGAEDVEDDVDAIDQDPGFAFVAGGGEGGEVVFFAQLAHFLGDGAHLAGAGAGGDDEKIGDGGETADIEDDDVAATGLKGEARGVKGELPRGREAVGGGFERGLRSDKSPPGLGSKHRRRRAGVDVV